MPTELPDAGDPDVLYILDLHCWMHRFFATTQGRAAHCFIEFIGNILRHQRPAHFAVCKDLPHPTFRAALYPKQANGVGYKANREPPNPQLLERLRWAAEMLEDVHGAPVYSAVGFEADDLIAALAQQAKDAGMRVVVIALDKDLMQLVDERCVLWDGKRIVVGPTEVTAKFGIQRVDQLRDYLAIVGDTADNVPGLHGAGPKAAIELLNEFGSLDEALQVAKFPYDRPFFQQRPKYRDMLRKQADAVRLSQKLVSLAFDAPIKFKPEETLRA